MMIARLVFVGLLLSAGGLRAAPIAGRDCSEGNVVCDGSLVCGGPETCVNGSVLSGIFTNVGLFSVGSGTSVFVAPGIPLVIFATTISIRGDLNGSGRGEVGGIGGDAGLPGSDGEGRGPGKGASASKGGGGAGYGGNGGDGSGAGSGLGVKGAAYDDTVLPISTGSLAQGSGGGGGGGATGQTSGSGGPGGASIYLEASSFTLTGTISVRGIPGGNSSGTGSGAPGGGGGGASGSLLLRCMNSAAVGGVITASGGKGGDVAGTGGSDTAYPGGGGGGGRVKIYYRQAAFSVAISTAGGSKGAKGGSGGDGAPAAQNGSIGAVSFGIVPSSPTSLTFSSVLTTSITWNWTAAPQWGDASAVSRKYRLYSDTVSYRSPGRSPQLVISSDTVSVAEQELTPNTTYTRYATAFTDYSDSLPSNSVSTHTLASRPGAALSTFTVVSAASLNLNWSAGQPANPSYTRYEVNRSTDVDFGTQVSTSYVVALSSSPGGLTPNTTYHFRIRAINLDNLPTALTPLVATATLAMDPAGPSFAQVNSTSFTFNWSGAGNPPQTRYIAEISTDNFATLVQSSITLNAGATFTGLTINILHYARVLAQNHNGLDTAFTATVATKTLAASVVPGAVVPAFTVLGPNSITANWSANGNPDPPNTDYTVSRATAADFTGNVFSALSVALSSSPSGLSANTTYYFRVQAPGTPFLVLGGTSTLTAAPTGPAFSSVSGSSLAFGWGASNPPNTLYEAEMSNDGFFTILSTSRTLNLSANFAALVPNTTHFARVRGVNWNGVLGDYSLEVATITLAVSPGPAASTFTFITADAMTANWAANANPVDTLYELNRSLSANFGVGVSTSFVVDLSSSPSALSANTTYYFRVRAINEGGIPSAFHDLGGKATLAFSPTNEVPPFSSVGMSSITLSWASNNPAGTRYRAEISTDGFVTVSRASVTLNTSAAFLELSTNTVYQAHAAALNSAEIASDFSATVSTATHATAPLNASVPFGAVSATTFTFTWEDGGNPGGTTYGVEVSSVSDFSILTSSLTTLALSRTFPGLLANTTYYAHVRAINMRNLPTAYTSSVSQVTLPRLPILVASPFSGVNSFGFTLSWTANGNPPNTTYAAEISKDNFVSVPLSSNTLNAMAIFTALTPNTTYTARVKALNFAGDAGPYSSPIVSTATLAVSPQSVASSFTLIDGGLTVLWSAGGNPFATRYEAEVSTRPDFALLSASSSVTGLSESFTLAANTTHYARVRARNHNAIPTADFVAGSEITYAAAPAVLASTSPGYVSVTTFSFTNTVSIGVGGLLFYRYFWDKNVTHAWNDQESAWTALGVLTTTATGNGFWYLHLRSYDFKARGYKTADIGPFQVALNEVKPPGQPVPAPGAFTAASGITWNWSPAISFGSTISTYVVSVGTTPIDFNVLVGSAAGPLTSFTLDPAVNGKTYYLKAKAIDEGEVSSPYSVVSSPGVLVDRTPPERLGAVSSDRKFSYDSVVVFSWSASADPESGIKGYRLDLGTTPDGNDLLNATDMGLELSYQATGLPSGKAVFARVRAENNAGGTSAFSDASSGIPVWTLNQAPPMTQPYNWPNPFDPRAGPTQIGFFLESPATVVIKFYTLEGDLLSEDSRSYGSAGNQVWPWGGRNGQGKMVAPGGYVVVIEKRYSGKKEIQKLKVALLY